MNPNIARSELKPLTNPAIVGNRRCDDVTAPNAETDSKTKVSIWTVCRILCMAAMLSQMPSPRCLAGTRTQRAFAAIAVARATLTLADEQPVLPDSPSRAVPRLVPLRIEVASEDHIAEVLPAQLVIGVWERGCPACLRLEHDIQSTLSPLGWQIGYRATDQIRFLHLSQMEAAPQIALYQNGIAIQQWNTYTTPAVLSRSLRTAWDSAPPLPAAVTMAGAGGTIHAKPQIDALFHWWREHIGEHVSATLSWDRTGAQTFPLLAKGDWSAVALCGRSGRCELAARGARNLPVDAIGFGYRVVGEDIVLDLDPLTFAGIARGLGPVSKETSKSSGGAPTPVKLDPLTLWTVVSVLRDIWSLLHPTCDLQLGGNVSATMAMDGDRMTATFTQCPSIRIVALFTLQLQVQRIEITETAIRVVFGGSRLIKERTFVVQ